MKLRLRITEDNGIQHIGISDSIFELEPGNDKGVTFYSNGIEYIVHLIAPADQPAHE